MSKFEEHFVSYGRLKEEWEWESPSLVNNPAFVLSLWVIYRGGGKGGKTSKVEGEMI